MLPKDILESIFTTIPRNILGYSAAVEWADIANITTSLRKHPIVVTLGLSSDVVDSGWTSATRFAHVEYAGDKQIHIYGQYRIVTLTINVHTRISSGVELIDAYMESLQRWALGTLPEHVSVAADNGTLDLSYLETNVHRRQTSFALRYWQTVSKEITNIDDIKTDLIIR
ncbi:MAG TPA: hypothetical protein O0X43_02400 [Methanocorpusculum sp.]|nr:hypothetical protein [Methanocorpusculum sp.]